MSRVNAANPHHQRGLERLTRDRDQRFATALHEVLQTPAGRLVFGELIARAGVYSRLWDPSARIHFNEGRREFGLELIELVTQAGDDVYLQMETELRARRAHDARTLAAVTTPRAEED